MAEAEFDIRPLADDHDRGEFNCGKPPLDKFIRELAPRYERQRIGRTYAATRPGERRVLGYHTLSTGAIPLDRIPKKHARGLPHHDHIPAVLLARLAVDESVRGRKLGRALLMHALHLALAIDERVAAFAVVVSAIDGEAVRFYEHHEFRRLQDQDCHLYLPMKTVADLFASGR